MAAVYERLWAEAFSHRTLKAIGLVVLAYHLLFVALLTLGTAAGGHLQC